MSGRTIPRYYRTSGLLIVLARLFFPLTVLSQEADLHGVVADSVTRDPIPFANIQIVGTSRGAAATTRGFYLIAGIPPGQYLIRVSAVGYRSRDQELTLLGGASLALDIWLAPTAIELGEVLVTEKERPPIQPPGASVQRVESKELKAVPVPVQEDVVRSLLILPGVLSTSDINSRFYVRGGSGDQNLFLLDGMRLYSPFHALGIYSVLDPNIIRSTEVYTGAFPAGYGGRLSSVVSLTTRDPRADRLAARAGINLLSSNLELQGPLSPGLQFLASGRHSVFPGTFSRLARIDRTFSFYDFLGKASADIPGFNKVQVLAFLTGDDLHSRNSAEAGYRWRNQLLGVTSSGLVANRMYLAAALYFSRSSASRTPREGSLIPPTSTDLQQPGLRIDATMYIPGSSDIYNFGIEFVLPEVSYKLVNTSGARRSYREPASEIGSWFRYQTSLATVRVDAGIHTNLMTLMRTGLRALEPRVSASQSLGGDWQMRLGYGRVMQTLVTANNEDDLIPIFDAWIGIPKDLRAEQADHYVAGIDGPITNSLSVSLQIYRKKYSDLVLYNRSKITDRDPDFLPGFGQSWGVESLVRISHAPIDIYFAHTFSRTDITSSGFTYPPRYDVRHIINAMATVSFSQSLDFSARWEFKSGYPFTQIIGFYGRLPLRDPIFDPFEDDSGLPYAILGLKNAARLTPYHRLDVSLSYRFGLLFLNGEFDASIVNVYDRENVFYFERETGRRVNMLPLFPSFTLSVSM